MDEVVLELTPDSNAPAIARRYVARHARSLPPEVVEDAELLVSEVVTNAVLYGAPGIVLRLTTSPPGIGVAVSDTGDILPRIPAEQPDEDAQSGRGLLIVAALASSWGVVPADPPPGKTVWFELRSSAE